MKVEYYAFRQKRLLYYHVPLQKSVIIAHVMNLIATPYSRGPGDYLKQFWSKSDKE